MIKEDIELREGQYLRDPPGDVHSRYLARRDAQPSAEPASDVVIGAVKLLWLCPVHYRIGVQQSHVR